MVVAVPPAPLAGRTSVAAKQLDGMTFVAFDPGLAIRRAIDRFLRKHGVQVDVALEFDNIENIKRAVEVSGVAILPVPTLGASESRARWRPCPSARQPHPAPGDHPPRGGELGLAAARFLGC